LGNAFGAVVAGGFEPVYTGRIEMEDNMVRRSLMLGLVFALWVLPCAAQSDSSSGQQDSSKPQPAAGAETKSQDQPADATKKKSKKVWTNDDVEGGKTDTSAVRSERSTGAAGGSSSSSAAAGTKSAAYDNLVKSYLKKLSPLRDQLAEIDRKVQQVKDFKGNARENTEQLLNNYAEKRASVQLKIDRIEEDARRDGVAPGDLR
jgi:hypothetical protein